MTAVFWLLAAGMTATVVALLWWTLRGAHGDGPTQRRRALLQAHAAGVIDDAELARKLAELDATLPGEAGTQQASRSLAVPIALAVALPLFAFGLYRAIGTPTALTPVKPIVQDTTATADPHTAAGATDAPAMENAITELAARLKSSPDDVEGWLLLARAYKATQRYAESFEAMTRALALSPDTLEVQLEHAESEALASLDRRFTDRGRSVLKNALAADASNQRALWLSGIDAVQREAYADAVRHWQSLESQLDPGSEIAGSVREQIARARQVGRLDGATSPSERAAADAPALGTSGSDAPDFAAANAITIEVDIAPALRARLGESDTLFVFARAAQGPKMPLAIQKRSASMLPLTLTLDDSMGMMPSLKLSSADTLVFGARVSSRGDATPAPGDLQVLTAPIERRSIDAPIRLVIDEIVR